MNRLQRGFMAVILAVYALLMWHWADADHYSEAVMGAFAFYWTALTCGVTSVLSIVFALGALTDIDF